jgi:hypothetical protein
MKTRNLKTPKATIARLTYLGKMINKYAHRWGEYPSSRLSNWVWEYDEIREDQPEVFRRFCEQNGYSPNHDAYDCLA